MNESDHQPELTGTDEDKPVAGPAAPKPENNELAWMKRHEQGAAGSKGTNALPGGVGLASNGSSHRATRKVERKTYLRGQAIDPPRRSQRSVRKRTEQDLLDEESDVPYAAWEKTTRSLVCSLIERQDRLSEQFLRKVNDLQYRVDDLEEVCDEIQQKDRMVSV